MSTRLRQNHSPVFKSKLALAAVRDDKTVAELAQLTEAHANQITLRRRQLFSGADGGFESEVSSAPPIDPRRYPAKAPK